MDNSPKIHIQSSFTHPCVICVTFFLLWNIKVDILKGKLQ